MACKNSSIMKNLRATAFNQMGIKDPGTDKSNLREENLTKEVCAVRSFFRRSGFLMHCQNPCDIPYAFDGKELCKDVVNICEYGHQKRREYAQKYIATEESFKQNKPAPVPYTCEMICITTAEKSHQDSIVNKKVKDIRAIIDSSLELIKDQVIGKHLFVCGI